MTADKQAYVPSGAMAKRALRMPRAADRGIRHTPGKCPERGPVAPIVNLPLPAHESEGARGPSPRGPGN